MEVFKFASISAIFLIKSSLRFFIIFFSFSKLISFSILFFTIFWRNESLESKKSVISILYFFIDSTSLLLRRTNEFRTTKIGKEIL